MEHQRPLICIIWLFACPFLVSSMKPGIRPSPKYDPGLRDMFNAHKMELKKHGGEKIKNVELVSSEGFVETTDSNHPAPKELVKTSAAWKLEQRLRNYALIIQDMENGYKTWVDVAVPGVRTVLSLFRKLKLPVVWSNFARRSDDGIYNALDRFFGPQGIKDEFNPAYMYGEDADETLDPIRPETEEELSRTILSNHLNKFVDKDDNGKEILNPMLRAWGVNTIVMTGAYTDVCVAATLYDAIDRYGYDIVLITDGVATATRNGKCMLNVLCEMVAKCHTADEFVKILEGNLDMIEKPKDELTGQVYKKWAEADGRTEL